MIITRTIHINDIEISADRIRRTFDQSELTKLAESISSVRGLQNPIVLHRGVLVSGERRTRAAEILLKQNRSVIFDGAPLPLGHVPYHELHNLPPDELLEAELEENVLRVDLPFAERIAAQAKLHELRKRQNPDQLPSDTMIEITGTDPSGRKLHEFRRELQLANHLSDPDIAKARSTKEALAIMDKKNRQVILSTLAEKVKGKSSVHQLINSDFRFVEIEPNSIDILLSDPPYGIDADKLPTQSGTESGTKHTYDDSFEYAKQVMTDLAACATDWLKPDSHVYIFHDVRFFSEWAKIWKAANFSVYPWPIIWRRVGASSLVGDANCPKHAYDGILFAQRGSKRIRTISEDVVEFHSPKSNFHPAEKPVELLVDLLKRSSYPGDRIIDPCCGSGSIFPAATVMQCTAIGIEKDSTHFTTAQSRLYFGEE